MLKMRIEIQVPDSHDTDTILALAQSWCEELWEDEETEDGDPMDTAPMVDDVSVEMVPA